MTMHTAGPDIAALYATHRLWLIRMAVLLVDDVGSAEDVVHDAFIALHQNADRVRDPQAAIGYLRTCVVNGARTAIRKRQTARKYQHHSVSPDEPPADTDLIVAAEHQEVLDALRQLPDRQREVLTLRYWSDLSEAAIAEALGISRGAVKSNASRGMDKLEAIMGGAR